MKVELVRYTPEPDLNCGEAAAICTDFKGDPLKALRGAMSSGHETVAEHASFTFHIEGVSRVLLAQITRHRLASFSVQSQRYCGADFEAVVPDSLAKPELVDSIVKVRIAAERAYREALALGVPEEDARYLTLQAGTTKMRLTMNARELRHFFSLRCCYRAQWEIRDLADKMLKLCRAAAPVLFEDAGPGCVRGHCPEGGQELWAEEEGACHMMDSFDLEAFAKEVNQLAHEKGWYDPEPTIAETTACIHCEWSEALQAYRNSEPLYTLVDEGDASKPVGIAVELVDGVLRILDAACEQDDLERILQEPPDIDFYQDLPALVTLLHEHTALCYEQYCIVDVCCWIKEQGLDPFKLMREKHEYNKTRPYRHGNKRC